MEDFRKLSKIAALDQKMPGPVCGDPDCEGLCAEAFDAAISLRLDPVEVLRKTIQRELLCIPAEDRSGRACRFGFRPSSDSLVLGGEKKKKEQADKEEIIHIFRTGINECKKCQALEGTRITPEIWADEEKMKSKGFWKQKNGEYLPHPNCKCHWEEKSETMKNFSKTIVDYTNLSWTKIKSSALATYQCSGVPASDEIKNKKVPNPLKEKLAKQIQLDPNEFEKWAQNIQIRISSEKATITADVPNVWICVNLLHGGSWYWDIPVVNMGVLSVKLCPISELGE